MKAIGGLIFVGCACIQPLLAQPCQYSWKDPVSGLFTDAGRWDPGPFPPAGCQGRAPRSDEYVAFRQGTYTVTIPETVEPIVAEFGTSGPPPFEPWDITFNIAKTFDPDTLATSGQLTVTGKGSLRVAELYNMGPDANFVLDQASAIFTKILPSAPGPRELSRQFLVRNKGKLSTLGNFGSFGVTVDGGMWEHSGGPSAVPDQIRIINGGEFKAGALKLTSVPLRFESGSTGQIDDLNTHNNVFISTGSVLTTKAVELRFGTSMVDGFGSKWSIGTLTLPESAIVLATNRAQLLCNQVIFANDPNNVTSLSARGAESRVTVATPLRVAHGTVNVTDGGTFTVPQAAVGLGGVVSVGRGAALLSGAQFKCDGDLNIGENGALGSPFNVTGGGRASARRVSIGRSTQASSLTIDAANGSSALFEMGGEMRVGDLGVGTLTVANGARLTFNGQINALIITPEERGDGQATVSGLDSALEIPGYIHVGRGGVGRFFVNGGGKVTTGGFNVGDVFGPNTRLASVVGDNSTLKTDFSSVANGTLRVFSGGFVQIVSELALQNPSLIDLSTGKLEIGNAGGSPVGICRVDRGVLRGTGTVRCSSLELIDRGVCEPGTALTADHVLTVDGGDYLQDVNGALVVNVWGGNPATFGVLNVGRGVTLNGKLIVHFLAGAQPKAGDQLGIVRFREGLVGAWSSIVIEGLKPDVKFEQKLLEPGVYGLAFLSAGESEECDDEEPRIDSIDQSVPGQIGLRISAGSCGFPRVEYSDDLKTWRLLTIFTVDDFGQAFVVDRSISLSHARFYRVVRL